VTTGAGTGEVEFTTSGHTGPPTPWLRTPEQLRAEVELVADEALGEIDHVVSFAPTEHLFGHLYGDVLPAVRGLTVYQHRYGELSLPRLPPGSRTLFVCLPSSWLMLRGLIDQITASPGAVALHGTGPTTAATAGVLEALAAKDFADFTAVEIFGSTETGGIATRPIGPRESAWRLLPDVELESSAEEDGFEQPLRVRSPRLARRHDMALRPDSWRMDDMVRRVDDRHFEFIGRRSRLIKVNGVRCDLGGVEARLRAHHPDLDLVCVPVRDTLRGEHYDLFVADDTPGGVDTGIDGGIDDTVATVWRDLARRLDPMPVPRTVHRLDTIPRTRTGKVKLDQLYARAERVPGGTS
jgi:acyl-coenzyme A synthetase/AMP-(fatty) acid ligase